MHISVCEAHWPLAAWEQHEFQGSQGLASYRHLALWDDSTHLEWISLKRLKRFLYPVRRDPWFPAVFILGIFTIQSKILILETRKIKCYNQQQHKANCTKTNFPGVCVIRFWGFCISYLIVILSPNWLDIGTWTKFADIIVFPSTLKETPAHFEL